MTISLSSYCLLATHLNTVIYRIFTTLQNSFVPHPPNSILQEIGKIPNAPFFSNFVTMRFHAEIEDMNCSLYFFLS